MKRSIYQRACDLVAQCPCQSAWCKGYVVGKRSGWVLGYLAARRDARREAKKKARGK